MITRSRKDDNGKAYHGRRKRIVNITKQHEEEYDT